VENLISNTGSEVEMKVICWTFLTDENYTVLNELDNVHKDALFKEMRRHGYMFDSFYRSSEYGVPVFSDGCRLVVNEDTWAKIMAELLGMNDWQLCRDWAETGIPEGASLVLPKPEDWGGEYDSDHFYHYVEVAEAYVSFVARKEGKSGRSIDDFVKEREAMLLYPLIRDRKLNMIDASKQIGVKVGELRDIYAQNGMTEYLLTDDELDEEIRNYARFLKNLKLNSVRIKAEDD